jgi:hypothetical protein
MVLTARRPEDLFEYGDIDDIKAAYRRLASAHHPDKGGDAADFQLVKNLYEAALKKIESGEPWDDGASVSWSISGSKFNMKYNFARPFEIGTMYSSRERVMFLLSESFADLGGESKKLMDSNRANPGPVGNERLRETNRWILPEPFPNLPAAISGSKTCIMLRKEKDIHPLRSVMDATGGQIPPVHAAWMIGRLMHVLCYLEWRGVVHGDISVDNFFVHLSNHSMHLYGGWWYSRPAGAKLLALPNRSIRLSPPHIIKKKVADKKLDWELARHTAVEILGAASPTELRMRKDVPANLTDFLSSPFTAPTAIELYKQWESARDAAFGARKFVTFETPANLYN